MTVGVDREIERPSAPHVSTPTTVVPPSGWDRGDAGEEGEKTEEFTAKGNFSGTGDDSSERSGGQ